MVTPDNDRISAFQLYVIGVLTVMGISIITVPRVLADAGGTNGWIIILVSAVIFSFVVAMIYYIYRKTGKQSFFEAVQELIGRPGAYVISVIFLIYSILIAAYELREFNEMAKNLLLPATPSWAIMGLLLVTACYILPKGIEGLARTFEVLFGVFVIFFIIQIIIVAPDVKFENLLPVMDISYKDFIKTVYYTFLSFAGFEMFLIFTPFAKARIKTGKYMYSSLLTVALAYVIIEILVLGKYGVKVTQTLTWPVMNLTKDVYVREAFVENPEIISMVILIISAFTTLAAYLYGAYAIVNQTIKVKKNWAVTVLLGIIVYIIANIPKNFSQIEQLGHILSRYFIPVVGFGIPFLLFAVSSFKKRREQRNV